MEKKFKKAKWLSGEALQIAVKRREEKSKGEKDISEEKMKAFYFILFFNFYFILLYNTV